MKAYKCDICGKFYDENVQEYERIDPISMASTGFAVTRIKFFGGDDSLTTRCHDVCNDCFTKFKKLVNEIRAGIK